MHDPNLSSTLVPYDLALPEPRSQSYATLLEALVRSCADAIFTRDLAGAITSWNPAATRIFGYSGEEVIGKPILRLIPSRLHTEELEIMRRLRVGEPMAHYESCRLTKAGNEIAVSLTVSPLRNARGEIIGVSKIVRDITEQQQLDNVRRLAAIIESSEDAILSKDLSGIITSWNQAATRLFGYTEGEMVGLSILKLIPPELQAEEQHIIRQLMAGRRIEHFETVRMRKNGERVDVSLTISPVRNSAGKIIGASKILRDISERKRLEFSLLEAEKIAATGRMAATIAHEINNPLEGLLNLIYLARVGSESPEIVELLEAAEMELARVSHIAQQTLGYYRENTSPVSVSLAELVQHVLRIYEPKLQSAHVAVNAHLDPACIVRVKRGEIMQVLSNIITNAVHAMPVGGKLNVALCSISLHGVPYALLDIQDTGGGIAAEHVQRIFEPFFTTRGSVGTGIGLWISRQFVESHGGTIDVRTCTHPDTHGTTMSISLPLAVPASPSADLLDPAALAN